MRDDARPFVHVQHLGAAEHAGVDQHDDADQEAVDALRCGKQLQNEQLGRDFRIFAGNARGGFTREAYALTGTHTGEDYRDAHAHQRQNLSNRHKNVLLAIFSLLLYWVYFSASPG